MRSTHRINSQHKRQMLALQSNPIARAMARASEHDARTQAEREFASQLLDTRIKLLSAVHGEDATELLACLAVVIGTPCEAGARIHGHTHPWVRQLHGALRTVQDLCTTYHYTWRDEYALALDRAVEVAGQQRNELDAQVFTQAWGEALWFCNAILQHQVTNEAIAA